MKAKERRSVAREARREDWKSRNFTEVGEEGEKEEGSEYLGEEGEKEEGEKEEGSEYLGVRLKLAQKINSYRDILCRQSNLELNN